MRNLQGRRTRPGRNGKKERTKGVEEWQYGRDEGNRGGKEARQAQINDGRKENAGTNRSK
jgi:hypothetical protein